MSEKTRLPHKGTLPEATPFSKPTGSEPAEPSATLPSKDSPPETASSVEIKRYSKNSGSSGRSVGLAANTDGARPTPSRGRLVYLEITRLNPSKRNARTHSKAQIDQIAGSITAFGFINPVLVDEADVVVAGHGRLLAAKELGLRRVPCLRVEHLSQAEKRAYVLADNRIAENAGWDPGLLKVELEYLSRVEIDVDVEVTGFSAPEIDIVLGAIEEEPPEAPIPTPPAAAETVVAPGDLWLLGPHRLICGDCRDTETINWLMGDSRARMVFTDPPYNLRIEGHVRGKGKVKHQDFVMAAGEMSGEAFTAFLEESLAQAARACRPGALVYVFMDWRHLGELLAAGKEVFSELINLCVWNKSSGGMGSLYRSQHELVFLFKKGGGRHVNNVELGRHGRNRTNVWSYPGVNSFGVGREEALACHPTVKPVALIADAILDASRRGEIILDGFAGSGSTLLAAERTGRIFHGVEIDSRYVQVTLQRWLEATGEGPVHEETGRTYQQVARRRGRKAGK